MESASPTMLIDTFNSRLTFPLKVQNLLNLDSKSWSLQWTEFIAHSKRFSIPFLDLAESPQILLLRTKPIDKF